MLGQQHQIHGIAEETDPDNLKDFENLGELVGNEGK